MLQTQLVETGEGCIWHLFTLTRSLQCHLPAFGVTPTVNPAWQEKFCEDHTWISSAFASHCISGNQNVVSSEKQKRAIAHYGIQKHCFAFSLLLCGLHGSSLLHGSARIWDLQWHMPACIWQCRGLFCLWGSTSTRSGLEAETGTLTVISTASHVFGWECYIPKESSAIIHHSCYRVRIDFRCLRLMERYFFLAFCIQL